VDIHFKDLLIGAVLGSC